MMPAKSEAQRRLMGAALSAKRGESKPSGKAADLAEHMSEKQLSDFAKKPVKKGPPVEDPSVNGTDGKIEKREDGWYCIDGDGDEVGGPFKTRIAAQNELAHAEHEDQHGDSGRPHIVISIGSAPHVPKAKRSRSGGVAMPDAGMMGGGAMPGM